MLAVSERVETLQAQLIDELERPEMQVARQAEDVKAFKKTTKEVDNFRTSIIRPPIESPKC